jgi:hypothetical protein
MTRTPTRARASIDTVTGELLALTEQGITRLTADGAAVDLTPIFDWECAAIGSGAVAVAGGGPIEWTAADGAQARIALPDSRIHRLAVAGPLVAGTTDDGRLLIWRPPAGTAAWSDLGFEPDGIVIGSDRVCVWGWAEDEHAALAVFRADGAPVMPTQPWPRPDVGAALGLADGVIAIGGTDALTLVSAAGQVVGSVDLPGLERIAGSGVELAWVRAQNRLVVGTGHLVGLRPEIHVTAELPMPGDDPFPDLAVVPGVGVLLAEGAGTHRVVLHRLAGDAWADPVRYDLPRTAQRH